MRKKEYLTLLEEVLKQNDVDRQEMHVILEDYEELYDGYLERDMSDTEMRSQHLFEDKNQTLWNCTKDIVVYNYQGYNFYSMKQSRKISK